MRTFALTSLILVIAGWAWGQDATFSDKCDDWKWIELLQTDRTQIETVFGKSISKDPTSNFQTYVTDSFKINIAFAKGGEYIAGCECIAPPDTAVSLYIAPHEMTLSDLNLDLRTFKKDSTFSPREISYYHAPSRTSITTELLQGDRGSTIERVIAIQIHASKAQKPE